MKNRLVALGILGLGTMLAAAACSGDDDDVSAGPSTSGAGAGGTASGGTANGGTANGGTANGGTSSGGTATAGSAGTSGSSAGGSIALGGEPGAGGTPSAGSAGEAGMGGTLEGGAGAGGAGGSVDDTVTLTPTTCGYTEVESDSSQDTSLNAKNALKVICGKFDPGHYSAGNGLLDKDSYEITLADNDLLRLELPSFKGLTRIELSFDQTTIIIDKPISVIHMSPFGGTVFFRLSAFSAADLPAAIPYQLSLVGDDVDARCAANKSAATFVEAGDGANNRANDVYQFVDSAATFTVANDSAEMTGITLGQSSYRVDGAAADVTRVGDFLDGDSYAFHTGPTTTQVTLRADWTGGHDVDLFVMKAGSTSRAGYSARFSNTSPEYATALVQPNSDYIAFVGGQYSGASFNYSLTLCGESYAFNGP